MSSDLEDYLHNEQGKTKVSTYATEHLLMARLLNAISKVHGEEQGEHSRNPLGNHLLAVSLDRLVSKCDGEQWITRAPVPVLSSPRNWHGPRPIECHSS